MIRDEHIDAAVAQGILSAEQARRLRDLARGEPMHRDVAEEPPAHPDDEKFRLIGGFNDVFVTIGVLLLVGALVGLARTIGFQAGIAVLALVIAWGLAEIFSRRMRLALPSIVLSLMFAGAALIAAFRIFDALAPTLGLARSDTAGLWIMAAGAGGLIAALAHERRFRVPIDVSIAATGIFVTATGALLLAAPDWTYANTELLTGLFGLGTFAAALRVDASDPNRLTRRSDIAFWLHLLAAPMIVHAVIPFLVGDIATLGTIEAVGTLVIFAVLGLIAIVIDRRALLVSGLIYAGIAIGFLITQNVESSLGLSLTLLALAAVVLGLSAGWRSLRRAILPLLPLGSLRHSIPPTV